MPSFDEATVLGQARSENFPVAMFLLPRRARDRLMAIYGVARLIDDVGDEADGDRLAQLDWLEADLGRATTGTAVHPLVRRLSPLIAELELSVQPFHDLIEANRLDQQGMRYETFDDLVGYCRLSAVPVGRLVLAVFGADTPGRLRLSDDVCIGLQVVEHLQDVGEDAARGRIYLPARDRAACQVTEDDLLSDHAPLALQQLVALEAARARNLLSAGDALAASLPWAQRAAVAGFVGGGLSALDAIQRAGYDVLGTRCRPSPVRTGVRTLATARGARSGEVAA